MAKSWVVDYEDRWNSIIEQQLRPLGVAARLITVAAPVQLEGILDSGEDFYFRCRYDACELSVGGEDPATVPKWSAEVRRWRETEASHLTPEDASAVLRELLDRYRSECHSE